MAMGSGDVRRGIYGQSVRPSDWALPRLVQQSAQEVKLVPEEMTDREKRAW